MQIESSFSLIDTVLSAMHEQTGRMNIITSGVADARKAVPEIVGIESDMGAEAGFGSFGSRINLDLLPVQMTNLDVAVQAYEVNVGVLGYYKQMTEETLELLV
jgi:flagellar basal body rod protein FlgC